MKKRPPKIDTGDLQYVERTFAFEYCSDYAWNVQTGMRVSIAGLRNQFGREVVTQWMQSARRRVVMPDQVVFDPSGKCAPACINLFAGIQMSPKAGNCEPILELLRHLCSGCVGV